MHTFHIISSFKTNAYVVACTSKITWVLRSAFSGASWWLRQPSEIYVTSVLCFYLVPVSFCCFGGYFKSTWYTDKWLQIIFKHTAFSVSQVSLSWVISLWLPEESGFVDFLRPLALHSEGMLHSARAEMCSVRLPDLIHFAILDASRDFTEISTKWLSICTTSQVELTKPASKIAATRTNTHTLENILDVGII